MGIFGRLFYSGKLPQPLRAELDAEGVVLLEEDLRGTVTYRNYRAPGKRYGIRKTRIAGAIAVTRQRVVAWGMGGRQIDVPLGYPGVEIARDGEEKVVFAPDTLDTQLAEWKRQGLRVGFTNGCFDILHPGHVKVLTAARAACDRLIVGLNSDASVRRLKGADRPVQDEQARAEVLAALEAVDLVVIFEEDTPINLITRITPSVLVKGGDYTREQVVGYEVVEAAGGVVVLVDILQGFSTTALVHRARGGGK